MNERRIPRNRSAGTDTTASIGGYEILDSIGQGGMGTVYKDRSADGSAVAVKLLHLHLCGIEESVHPFHP